MKHAAIFVTVLALAICGLATYTSHPEAQVRNAVGKVMPADAAPPDRQVFRFLNDEPTNLDIGVAIYEVGGIVFLFERLTMLDHNNRRDPRRRFRMDFVGGPDALDLSDAARRPVERRPAGDGPRFRIQLQAHAGPRLGQRLRLLLLQHQGREGVQTRGRTPIRIRWACTRRMT